MNRSFKVFVATVLALSLCLSFGSAFAKKDNKPPKAPAPTPTITITELSLSNIAKDFLTPNGDATYTVVTGQKYLAKATVSAKTSLRWRSSKSSVANVDSRGTIHCVKPGSARITVSNKSGTASAFIDLVVQKNMTVFDGAIENNSVKKIYLKGKNLMVDVVIVNSSTTEILEVAPDLKFFLTLKGVEYPDHEVKTGHLRSEIPAGGTGTAVYKIGKVDPRTIWLLNATATCTAP